MASISRNGVMIPHSLARYSYSIPWLTNDRDTILTLELGHNVTLRYENPLWDNTLIPMDLNVPTLRVEQPNGEIIAITPTRKIVDVVRSCV
jgi:hypothetical protein